MTSERKPNKDAKTAPTNLRAYTDVEAIGSGWWAERAIAELECVMAVACSSRDGVVSGLDRFLVL